MIEPEIGDLIKVVEECRWCYEGIPLAGMVCQKVRDNGGFFAFTQVTPIGGKLNGVLIYLTRNDIEEVYTDG